jgi:CDP-glucose 4,6-dehydratase
MSFGDCYRGQRVWLTGDTGFKGSWLAFWLRRLGAEVLGTALEPETAEGPFVRAALPQLIRHETADVRDADRMAALARDFAPQVVFHLAAQALVRRSYADPVETFDVNVRGAAHVLDAVRRAGRPCAVVVVTSDKCYENREEDYAYREDDPMGGHDPYSRLQGLRRTGGGVLPFRLFRSGRRDPAGHRARGQRDRSRRLGGGPHRARCRAGDSHGPEAGRAQSARRAAVAARAGAAGRLPAAGPSLAGAGGGRRRRLELRAGADQRAHRRRPGGAFCRAWGAGAAWEAAPNPAQPHEAHLLQLAIDKAGTRLGWRPKWDFETTVRRTAEGYRTLLEAQDAAAVRSFLDAEIAAYEAEH